MEKKRPHSPSASNSPQLASQRRSSPSSKVCLPVWCEIDDGQPSCLDFYVFDLEQKPKEDDDEGFTMVKPALRLKNNYDSFCLLNSEIYIFASSLLPESKSVRRYNLWGEGSCNGTFYMNSFKRLACAIATPDRRKMLIFSREIHADDVDSGFINFELFDPITTKFEQLPALMPKGFPDVLSVDTYGFLDDDTFLIHIDDERRTMFSLDLVGPPEDRGWVVFGHGGVLTDYTFSVVGRSLLFGSNAYAAYDFPKGGLVYEVPGPGTARPREWFRQGDQRLTTFLDEGKCRGDEGHRLCVLEVNYDEPFFEQPFLKYPQVHIAVYELKVTKCCGQEQRPVEPAALLRKFELDSNTYFLFLPDKLYPLSD
ncbi:hypothetical protein OROGR_023322 [Orobanche gracilis]